MHFGRLILIHLFWIVPALILFLVWSFRRKLVLLQRFAHIEMLKRMMGHVSIHRQYIKAGLIVTTVVFLILALMEPKWGATWEQVHRRGIDVIVAVDVSRSMLATDEKPNRLERAKRAILDLLNLMDGDRIGLIAFAGSAFVQCPLTLDYGAAKMFVNEIEPQLIPRGGTRIGDAIRKAIAAFEGDVKKHRALILITDGEDHDSNPLGAAEEARKKGIRIFCIGIGSPKGTPIQLTNEAGGMTYLKDTEGNQVLSKLDETLLQKIAIETGGAYVPAQKSGLELDEIYTRRIAEMEEKDLESKREKRYEHRFQWPLSIAAFLLVIETITSDKKRKSPQDIYSSSV
jgi:Ca-activated chloride channel family protein